MGKKVAIVGLSFRLPGTSPATYWGDLLAKKDLISQVEAGRWSLGAYQHPDSSHPGTSYTFSAGSIGDVSGFDAGFFGISPREASMMDPQQRILLELTWEAIERAGVPASSLKGSDCGVFVGIASADYSYRFADDMGVIDSSVATGNTSSIAANRISYVFDLHGPSLAIDTACSSSMFAFHQACQSILSGESSQALVGGVSLHNHPFGFLAFSKATMLSKTGRCQVFDKDADGYVRSEGGGVFYLKDYEAALRDGNNILALVAGTAVNTDGHKPTMTVPCYKSQMRLMEQVYRRAGIDPDQIDYLEAHGTGTPVGDPIETKAIGEALGKRRRQPLPIGSVKSNMGHLEAASAVAGLVKAIYSLQNRWVPATISMKTPNPNIRFDEWNIHVPADSYPLPESGQITIGVNSFGFGGANAHVILQSPPEVKQPSTQIGSSDDKAVPLFITARDPEALHQAAVQMHDHLQVERQVGFYDIAYASRFQRDLQKQCALVMAQSTEQATAMLAQALATGDLESCPDIFTGTVLPEVGGPAFVYDGNGCQWDGMGRQLLDQSPVFHTAVEEIDALFTQLADYSLLDELSGHNGEGRLVRTEIAQPALFALQVGITRVLQSQGIRPRAVVGHSVGEVAAAWAAGALTLDDAVRVIYYRSHHQGKTAGFGEMTAVALGEEEITVLLERPQFNRLALAGINSTKGVTVAGDSRLLKELETLLSERSVSYKRLDLNYAFHSPVMDPIEMGLRQDLANITPRPTEIPYFSTVTGGVLAGEYLSADYWWENIRKPVLFHSAIQGMMDQKIHLFVELGGHPVLRTYLADLLRANDAQGMVIPTITRDQAGLIGLSAAAAQVMMTLDDAQLTAWFPQKGRFASLPTYPWQRSPLWHPVTSESCGLLQREYRHPLLGYALKHQPLTWESEFDLQRQEWLADHQVGDAVVFPGTGYVELGMAASRAWKDEAVTELEDLEIISPLLLGEKQSKIVRVNVTPKSGDIKVASRTLGDSEQWTEHMRARLVADPSDRALNLMCPERPARAPDFDQEKHADYMERSGLFYGPAFKLMRCGWKEQGCAIGEFVDYEEVLTDLEQYTAHPALLDCTFQLIAHLMDGQKVQEGFAHIPVRIDRLHMRNLSGRPRWAQARIIHHSPHSLSADFALYDQEGRALVVIKEARFKKVRLHRSASQPLSFLDYHLTAIPDRMSSNGPHMDRQRLQQALIQASTGWHSSSEHRLYAEEVEPLLNTLCELYLSDALTGLCDHQGLLPTSRIEQLCRANPDIAGLLQFMRQLALDNELMVAVEGGWRPGPVDPEITCEAVWRALVNDYPGFSYLALLLGRAGLWLKGVIHGEVSAEELRLPNADFDHLMGRVMGNGFIGLARSVYEVLEQQRDMLADGQRLSVLEVSHGEARFAQQIAPKIHFTQCNYRCISLTDEGHAENLMLQKAHPLLDVEPFGGFDADEGGHQLGLVPLNFQSIEESRQVIGRLTQVMAPGAPVLFVGLHKSAWIDLALGTAPAWWMETEADKFTSQHLSVQQWSQLLRELGYQDVQPIPDDQDGQSGGYLLLATAPDREKTIDKTAELPIHHWLLVDHESSAQGLSQQLQQQLERVGQPVSRLSLTDASSVSSALIAAGIDPAECERVVYFASGSSADLLEDLSTDCDITRQLSDLGEVSATPRLSWTITRGVGGIFPCDQPQSTLATTPDQGLANGAAVWGFVRTLMNEYAALEWRLIDLPATVLQERAADLLLAELMQPGAETELVLSSQGGRFAPRLRMESAPGTSQLSEAADSPSFALGFEQPGQLRNLRWEAQCVPPLKADDIEIEVKATGLNFRDVMFTLGLLSDEAVENGFAGPTLGLEFSGKVLRTGAGVTGFNVGDEVLGFGPASFSNRVIARSEAIAIKPAHINFQAAATIPSTFFTVYYALHHLAQLQPDERVLIHGAAGGVGIAAIQVAQWIGAEIHATAGSPEKRDFLRMMGVKHIYDSRSYDFAEEILTRTADGRGVDVVLNSLAGEAINRNLRVLKPFGRFLELGKRDFYENTHIGLRPFRNNISYFGIDADQIMQERPALTQRLFREMMALFQQEVLHPLPYTVFDAHRIEEAFRYMQQARQIGKIVVTYDGGTPRIHSDKSDWVAEGALQLDDQGSYLVTGGLGGFGLRTAQWLVEKGARHLILISRRGPGGNEAKTAIAELRQAGVGVLACSCDVTDRAALQRLITSSQAEMPPIRGVVHAATVIEDSLARNLTREKIQQGLAAKVLGACYLHELTQSHDLDLFVLFSSATTLFGNPGQGSYVAANHWLEALAAHRRHQGLPVTCIRWGAIDDVGFLARNDEIKAALQSRMGGAAMDSASALARMEKMIQHGSPTLGVLELEWPALSRFLPTAEHTKFSEIALAVDDYDSDEDAHEEIQRLLAALTGDELHGAFVEILKAELARVLLVPVEKIDADESVYNMGLDSLMGVEFMMGIESQFGVQIPVMALSEATTLSKIAHRVILEIDGPESSAGEEAMDDIKGVALQHGVDLSDQQASMEALASALASGAPTQPMIY